MPPVPCDAERIARLERGLAAARREITDLRSREQRTHDEVAELFTELAQALEVIAASIEELAPEDERFGWSDRTGVMGRACELQGVLRIFRGNLVDLVAARATVARAPSARQLAHGGV